MKIELVKIERRNGDVFMHIREEGKIEALEIFCIETNGRKLPDEEIKAVDTFLNFKSEKETIVDSKEI